MSSVQSDPSLGGGSHPETSESTRHLVTRYFSPSKEKLESTLELLHSYEEILQRDVFLTRLYGLGLTSDEIADSFFSLFSSSKPRVLEIKQTGDTTIHWADVLRSSTYNRERQEAGMFHVRIDKGEALVELSKRDCTIIETGLARKMIDPQTYSDDRDSEMHVIGLVKAQITPWRDMSIQCSYIARGPPPKMWLARLISINAVTEAIENVLSGLSQRTEALGNSNRGLEYQQNASSTATGINLDAFIASGDQEASEPARNPQQRGICHGLAKNPKGKGGGPTWTPEEDALLGSWFEKHRSLPEKDIEREYYQFSGKNRTYKSLQARLYRQNLGHLSNKGKKSPLEPETLPEPSLARAPEETQALADSVRLSRAMRLISESCSSAPQQNSRPIELENGVTSLQNLRRRSSRSPDANNNLEPAVQPEILLLTDKDNPSDANNDGLERANESTLRNNESSEKTTPSTHPQASNYEQTSPPRTGVYREDPQSHNPGSSADTHSFFTPGDDLTMPHRSHGEGSSIQEHVTRDEPGTTQVNGNLSAFQSLDTEMVDTQREVCYPHNWTGPAGQGEDPFSVQSGTSQNLGLQCPPTFRSFDRAMVATGESTTAQTTVNTDRPIISSDRQGLAQGIEPPKRKRQYTRRTKTGCLTCRQKRRKCDEQRPSCENCVRSGIQCAGYDLPAPPQTTIAPVSRTHSNPSEPSESPAVASLVDPSSAQPPIYTDTSGSGTGTWMSNHTRPNYGGSSQEYTTSAQNQQSLPAYEPPSDIRSGLPNQTIPSIDHLFRQTGTTL